MKDKGPKMKTLVKERVKDRLRIVCLIVVGTLILSGCKDNVINPISSFSPGNYLLCYCGYGKIKINNILGTNPQNISLQDANYKSGYVDDYPRWSPDGRYIAFERLRPDTFYNPFVYVYDIQNKTYTNLTSDGGEESLLPQWTPNGKVYFSYERPVLSPTATYIMNPDGSGKKKILNFSASIYFYQDSYTFLYINGTEVHKTNIDSTFDVLMLVLPPPAQEQYVTIRDFNPITGEFLVNTNIIPGLSNVIAAYSVETKQFKVFVTNHDGYNVGAPRYSKDYSKITFFEVDTTTYTKEYLSVFENGKSRRIVQLIGSTSGGDFFDASPLGFSSDSKYIAFVKNVSPGGSWVSWKSYVYTVEVATGVTCNVDLGFSVNWSPQQ